MAQTRFKLQVLSQTAKETELPCTYVMFCFLRMHFAYETVCSMIGQDSVSPIMTLFECTRDTDIADDCLCI